MENTLENKKKFFALYYDVPCIQNDEWIWRENDEFGKLPYGSDLTDCYANLEPLSAITDEDAKKLGYRCSDHFLSDANEDYWKDELRSIGYAVKWMDLSVEQLEEYGWIKLKK